MRKNLSLGKLKMDAGYRVSVNLGKNGPQICADFVTRMNADKTRNKKKKTMEAQRHGEEKINHESHEWTNVTNYSCYSFNSRNS